MLNVDWLRTSPVQKNRAIDPQYKLLPYDSNNLVTVLTPNPTSPRFYRTEKTSERKFAPGKHEQRRYESCHVWHIKNGRIQSANNHLFTNIS